MPSKHSVCVFLLAMVCTSLLTAASFANEATREQMVNSSLGVLLKHFSLPVANSSGLTRKQFMQFLQSATSHSEDFLLSVLGSCKASDGNCTRQAECPGITEIFNAMAIGDFLPRERIADAIPVSMSTLISKNCSAGVSEDIYHSKNSNKPTAAEAWGCGIGFVSLIIVISNVGVFLGPIMNKRFFKRLLQFLVAMGAGALISTSLLVLIPEAFHIQAIEELNHSYIWKSSVIVVSIYVFFSLERLLKTVLYNRRSVKPRDSDDVSVETGENSMAPLTDLNMDIMIKAPMENGHSHFHLPTEQAQDKVTLAWMVMAGDVIHNFVDGLSMGAAFTEDIALGISISLAIISEELPHELADIAILLHSGLSIKKSLLVNFLSACVCYLGLILGIVLGSSIAEASQWIFAMAGGLFLYIPLVDMLPDMSDHLDLLLQQGGHEAKIVACLHTLGLLIGGGIVISIVNVNTFILAP
ncbi:metal cation symporter ZIP14-like [Biomphalaria glabrata]|uniref:Metal cation symporter ZIP14-like n=2 Tax=Biomphalaria glabrata TaxID=6526 RepID=A0A9W3BM10_BIOGL|nr:metal cation symporter ZIP14-like [Biomphalaria glabrata]XP_055900620.1 metal cation symporter ZIP14-like [Biomphalaria glabrata]KAI8759864.1 metal cation symporter ZIP14 [Biomphalaria glabrata]